MIEVQSQDTAIGLIYETIDYPKFSLLEGNRSIQKRKDLERDILKNGMKEPITVNENFEIIDGQHRFTIAQYLHMPVLYKIDKNADINTAVSFNANSKRWGLLDYLHRYAATGNKDYQEIIRIVDELKIPTATILKIASGKRNMGAHGTRKETMQGKFSFYNYDAFMLFLNRYKKFVRETRTEENRDLLSAFFNIYSIKELKYNRMLEKAKANDFANRVRGLRNPSLILEQLVNIYNDGLSSNSKSFLSYDYDIRAKTLSLTDPVDESIAKV